MATITHSLQEVISALNAKIAELESNREMVEAKVREGGNTLNAETLAQINDKLCSAQSARKLLMDSCCTSQSCNFEWYP